MKKSRIFLAVIFLGMLSLALSCGGGGSSSGGSDGGGNPTDTTAPTNTTEANFINGGAASTSSTAVTLSISATDNVGVVGYYVSESSANPDALASGWTAISSTTSYSGNAPFTLSSGDGTKTVYVWFKDAAGNVSPSASDSITLSATLTAAEAPEAAGAVIQAANLVGTAGTMGEIQASSSSSGSSAKAHSKAPLRSVLDKVISISKTQKHKAGVHAMGSVPPETMSCSDGGSVTVSATWTGPDNPTDLSQIVDFQGNMTFNSCKEDTMTFSGGMTVRFDGSLSDFDSLTITTTNFFFSDTATGDSLTMNLTMTFSDFTFSGDDLTSATVAITGSISGNVEGEPVNVQCDGYTMAFSSDSSGTTVTVSGKIKPVCLKGWVTITTNTPLFIPNGATCPTAGDIVATSGSDSVRVVVSSDSKITVYFNGTVVQTYNNCEEVDGLCAG